MSFTKVFKSLADTFALAVGISEGENLQTRYTIKRESNRDESLFNAFVAHLENDLSLPNKDKDLNFVMDNTFGELDDFQLRIVSDFMDLKPSAEDYVSAFESFLKNLHIGFLFGSFQTPYYDGFGKKQDSKNLNHIYAENGITKPLDKEPYILYLLKQDFNKKMGSDFSLPSILTLSFNINGPNYLEFKSNLFSFLERHSDKIKENNPKSHKDEDSKLKSFISSESHLYRALFGILKHEDIEEFACFLPSIFNKKNDGSLLTDCSNAEAPEISNIHTINVNPGYLSNNYIGIDTIPIAITACRAVDFFINNYLSKHLSSSFPNEEKNPLQLSIETKGNIRKENLTEIINAIIMIALEENLLKKLPTKPKEQFDFSPHSIRAMAKQLDCIALSNILPVKSDKKIRQKI